MKILAAICFLVVGASAQLGPSGLVDPDGKNVQFSHDYADSIVLIGPSGAVTKTGENLQLTAGQAALHAPLPVHSLVKRDLLGPSGFIAKDGQLRHLPPGVTLVLSGPGGIVFSDGGNIQRTN